ncbi:uncharacterized protein [Palaemon carinicauda]|uniref:uncharacterized protein n=1 Tax=Palaemon carinicauda TaxID=392227 RepID=UPI0035B615A8
MIYKRSRTKVITAVGETETFEVNVGLYQGSALSAFLFVFVLDVLSERIRKEELWELLYVDDLVITAEKEEELQRRVVEGQETLERGGFRVSVDKIEAVVSSKEGRDRIALRESKGAVIKQVEHFGHLRSTMNLEGGCEVEVENRQKQKGDSGWR